MGFCTQTDVEELLQITIADAAKIASVERAITEATSAIKNYTHQEIEQTEDDEITLDCSGISSKLFLPQLPVTEVSVVVEDDETLTAGSDEDYQLGQWGVLHRVSAKWAAGIQIITVTYTHGHATIPVVIEAAHVLALAALDKPQRIAGYLALFSADPRISGIIDSEQAVVQMEADVSFPTAAIDI